MKDVIIKDYKMDRMIEYTNFSDKTAIVSVWYGWHMDHDKSFYGSRRKAKRYFKQLRKEYNI